MLFVDASLAFGPEVSAVPTAPPPPEKGPREAVSPGKNLDLLPVRARNVSFRGTIADMPTGTVTGTWTVIDETDATWTVTVTERTRVVPPVVEPAPGDAVHVLGRREEDTGYAVVAKHLVVKKRNQSQVRPIQFRGEIEALPVPTDTVTGIVNYLGEWVVSGFTVTVDSRTMILPNKRTPEVGMRANIVAFEQSDGTLWAKHITLHRPDGVENEVEIEGVIRELPDPPYLGTWIVDGFTVTVTGTTELKGATPAVSLTAKVKGQKLDDDTLMANEIIVRGSEHKEVEFEGTLLVFTDTRPSEWVIETKTPSGTEQVSVTVTSDTNIRTNTGPVEVGAWVEIKALEQTDGTLIAVRITVEDDADEEIRVEFEGTVVVTDDIPGDWVIETDESERITMTVISDTVIVPPGMTLTLGSSVEVKAMRHDETLTALWIKIEVSNAPQPPVEAPLRDNRTVIGNEPFAWRQRGPRQSFNPPNRSYRR
jgi:hypothetical protein